MIDGEGGRWHNHQEGRLLGPQALDREIRLYGAAQPAEHFRA